MRILLITCLATLIRAAGAPVVLVENSRPKSAIVAAAEERPAAEELARYIQKATGAQLPIVDSPARVGKSQVPILVGAAVAPPDIAASLRKLRPDSILIRVDDKAVTLSGNPAQGTTFAVYTFLEKVMGVRWLWPGELGQIVPRMTSLRLEASSFQEEPAFTVQRVGSLSESGTLVPSYRWTRYNDYLLAFNPLWRLREWAAAVPTRREAGWRSQIRTALKVPDPLPPLDPKTHSRFEPAPGVVAERVTYGTQFGMRIPAIVYFPKVRVGKAPALIVVNGHGGDKYTWYSFYSGILYARAGAVVLTFDPTGEGERNRDRKSGTRAHDRLEPVNARDHEELARRQGGLIVSDLMQAVSYLLQRPEVDPTRIGAMGYSMGSMIVALTGAIEPRLHACVVAAGGGLQIPGKEFKPGSKPSCIQGLPYRALSFLGDPPAVIYSLHASRGPTLVVNGELDWDGTPRAKSDPAWFQALRQRTIDFRGSARGIFDIGAFQPGAIHRPYFVTKDVARWLHRQLKFPNWTPATIEKMPETYIREWAAKEKVEIDPSYTTEGLESGTHALGTGVPGVPRADLHVFSREEWERMKDRLILDAWVTRTREAIRSRQAQGSTAK